MAENEQVNTKEAILSHLEDTYGIVTEACKRAGIGRTIFYEWKKNDPVFAAAVDEIQDVALDFVEGKLFERINGVEVIKGVDKDGEEIVYSLPPDTQAISLYLKTRGKKRGYIERTELTGADGGPVQVTGMIIT